MKPLIFYRCLDEFFGVVETVKLIQKKFCGSFKKHPNIKFTTEIQNNKCMYFLVASIDNNSAIVATSTFGKLMHTAQTRDYIIRNEEVCTTSV